MTDVENVRAVRDDKLWEIELKAEIPAARLAHYRDEALSEMQKTVKLDGFRPGHAPKEAILRIYGEAEVMRHAAEHAVRHVLPELLAAEKANIVDAPKVSIEPPLEGKPLAFTARAPLAPEIELGDYAALARAANNAAKPVEVSDEEYKEALAHLKRERARIERIEQGKDAAKAAKEARDLNESDLPDLDDAFVQSMGFENAEAFSQKLRENIKTEKEMRELEKRRAALLEEIVKKSKISYPAVMKEYELDDMEARLAADLSRMGTSLDAYLQEVKKTRESLRAEWNDAADTRAKVRLILGEIARREGIEPDQERLEKEVAHAKEHYKDINEASLRAHVAHALRNERVMAHLDTLR